MKKRVVFILVLTIAVELVIGYSALNTANMLAASGRATAQTQIVSYTP